MCMVARTAIGGCILDAYSMHICMCILDKTAIDVCMLDENMYVYNWTNCA